ncbi:MAG: transcription termination/antitermination NusG family protein, partial [Planctomycetia bacterium]
MNASHDSHSDGTDDSGVHAAAEPQGHAAGHADAPVTRPPAEPVGGAASPSTADSSDDDDDGTPAELADPFSGSEDAKPVSTASDDDDAQAAGARDWYILKVQSNREDSIRETLLRRIKMQGLDRFFGDVVVPKEQVTEFKGGKKRIVWRKLYPG